MNRKNKYITTILSLLLILTAAGSKLFAEVKGELSGMELVKALQGGGFNIYFRHAATDWSKSDNVMKAGDWTSCNPDRVRQLSDQGRKTSIEIGKAMKKLKIPVGEVLASPYCRTVETASLLNLGKVKTTTDIMNLRSANYFGGVNAVIKRARRRLSTKPPPGTNIVLVAHGNVAREATPVYPGEAEAAVFRPDGRGGFVYVGSLTPVEWERLAR